MARGDSVPNMTASAGDPGPIPSQSRARGYRLFITWCVLAGLFILGELIVVTSALPVATRTFVSVSLLAASGPVLAISCAFRMRGLRDRRSRAWFLLMLGALFGAAANIATNLAGTDRKSIAAAFGDIGLMVALLFGILSMLSFPSGRRRRTDLARMVLDGVVVGGSILFLTTVLVYPPLLSTHQITTLADVTALAVPIEDVVAATLAVLLIMRSGGSDRPVLIMVSIGFGFYTISDLCFGLLSAQGTFRYGGIIDLGWILGYALLAVAARHPRAGQPPPIGLPREASPVAGTVTMFAVFITAAFVGLLGDVNPVNNVLWLVALVAVAIRQILLVFDNNKLRQNLERRVAERTRDLRRLTERSELLLKSVGDGIYGVDTAGRITFINPAAARVLGHPPAELIGRSAHNTFHARHADGSPSPENQCYVTEAVRDGFAAISEEDNYLRADGRQFPVEVTATPLTVGSPSGADGTGGSTSGAVVVFRDITQRREVDRIKNEFVSMVSHELRTPLTSIRGSLGLLAGGALGVLPDRAAHLLSIAQDSCERLTRLINDILDVERFESGSIPMEIGRHRASELVNAAVLQVGQLATDSRIALSIGRVDGTVTADADRVLQALINLISNAVKFSLAGDSVMVSAIPRGGFVEFSITDHGRGIPPDRLDSIFNRFEQVDSSDSRDKGGSGLGLAISRSIVERLGGRIWARSDPVRGTVFTFTLPRAERSEPAGDGARPTVLVCDDDDYAVEVMCGLLEARGYHAIGVTDGREAIERALIDPPAVVVVDLAMPGTSGAEVIAAFGRHTATRDLPVVVVSGLNPTTNPELAARVSGWLVKPIDEERLAHTVRTALVEPVAESTVLLVDDDDMSSDLTARLERRGLTVQHSRSLPDALQICQRAWPDVVVIDLQLRDDDGVDLLTHLHRHGVERLAVLGYNAANVESGHTALPVSRAVFLARGNVTAQLLEDNVIDLLDLSTAGPTRATANDDDIEREEDDDEEDQPKPRRALDVSATNP